jgi:CubicO group peptidase (beta-lactamase class C family)
LQLLDEVVAAIVAAYPALSISVDYLNGSSVSTLHHSGDLTPAPDDDSIYAIGSITKTFTGALLGAAVAAGNVSLTTPVKVNTLATSSCLNP